MKVMSWNVNGTFPPEGSPDAIEDQVEWLDSLESLPDVLMLQEVNPNRQDLWHTFLLERLDYQDLTDTIEQARELDNSNGHITAVNAPRSISSNKAHPNGLGSEQLESAYRGLEFPEKILVTDIEQPGGDIETWNIRAVPGRDYGEEKLKILEFAYDWIQKAGRTPRILAGDLNSPKEELSDGQAITFGQERTPELRKRGTTAELNVLKGLGQFGMLDIFRAEHGYGSIEAFDVSHNEKRFDHLFASKELSPTGCKYLREGLEYSDHAPVVATFDL